MKAGIFALCLLAPCTGFGEIYKWVDKNGQTHYGEKPKSQSPQKIILPKQNTNSGKAAAAEKQRLENVKKWVNARQQERKKDKQEKRELKEQLAAKNKKCNELKNDLKDIETGGVIWYQLDKEGNRQFYSDDDIETRKNDLRKDLKNNCK